MNIDEAWALLQKNQNKITKETAVSRIDWKHESCDLWLGVNASGQPFLAIQTLDKQIAGGLDLQRFISFDIDIVERFSKVFIEIKLSKNNFRDHFIVFIKDIVNYANDNLGVKNVAGMTLERIESWDEFFSREKGAIFSMAEMIGLWGELEFLKEMLTSASLPSIDLINAWQASSGFDKDFRFKKSSIEVKASLARKNARFKISSEIQLESDSINPLFLVGYIFSPDAKNTYSLNHLIDECRSYIKNNKALNEFDLKVLKRGFSEADKVYYESFLFGVSKRYNFKVNSDFPKIIMSMIPASISNVNYDINPEMCTEFSVTSLEIYNGIN